MCKTSFRRDFGKEILVGKLNLVAMISFIKSDWQLFEAEVEQLFRRYGRAGYKLTYQPLLVPLKRLQNNSCKDLLTILSMVVGNAVKKHINSVSDAVEALVKLTKGEGLGFKWLRAPVTSVFTLSSRIYLSEDVSKGLQSTVLARKDIVKGFFKDFVASVAKRLQFVGYNIVFFDEPVLTFFIGRRILFGWLEDEIIDSYLWSTKSKDTRDCF